ncbi:hypothetical protein K488DRAFT_28500, partial [Vararia minispora EC-137]
LAPLDLLLNVTKSAARTATPPLMPLIALIASAPFLAMMSFLVGFYVWRSGGVNWRISLDLQYGDGLQPYAEALLPTMSLVDPYDIFLHLTMPATQANYDLGNFMASLSLNISRSRNLITVRKPVILLPPASSIFSKPKTASLTVPLLTEYIAGSSKAIARVELGRKDHWKNLGPGQGREVSVLAVTLEGVLKYHGIRGFVSRYPLLAASISASSFFVISFATLILFLAPAMIWRY